MTDAGRYFEDEAEYRFERVHSLFETCSRLGVDVSLNEEYGKINIAGPIGFDRSELMCSLMEWRWEILETLKYLEDRDGS